MRAEFVRGNKINMWVAYCGKNPCGYGDNRYDVLMIRLSDYDYVLPPELVAETPAEPRDSARLLVYDTARDTIDCDIFRHIARYLPAPSLLVTNNTKVVPARLWLKKETGGKIQVLLMVNEYRPKDAIVKGMTDRNITAGAKLFFQSGDYLEVSGQEEQFFLFRPSVHRKRLFALLKKEGVTPIPPYIKNNPLPEEALRKRYQSVFAKHPGSVAAPTASMHFTGRLLAELDARGIAHTAVTLHVGAGTFAPISERALGTKKLFTEYYEVSAESAQSVAEAKSAGVPVIAVGTTALRTLESAARSCAHAECRARRSPVHDPQDIRLCRISSKTELFIFPPYDFNIADGLITNFHVPKSSLMLLVDAFLESKNARRRILDLYKFAIAERFRFFSFGDAMLIK